MLEWGFNDRIRNAYFSSRKRLGQTIFSIKECNINQEILKTKNELILYLENQIAIGGDEKYKKN